MKKLNVLLAASFILIGANSNAQENRSHNNAVPTTGTPGVTKGYYAIGNNAQKLQAPTPLGFYEGEHPEVQKGYYAIADNNKKLPRKLTIESQPVNVKPIAPKGYYSIDRNREQQKR